MKTKKRLPMILVLCLIFVLALPMTAFAGSITINPPAGANLDANSYKAFQIFTAEPTATGDNVVYTLNDDFKAFEAIADKPWTGKLKTYIEDLTDSDGTVSPASQVKLEALAVELWNWSYGKGFAFDATGNSGSVTFTGLDSGYYLIAGDINRAGSTAKAFATLTNVKDSDDSVTINAKGDVPFISKEVYNHHSSDYEKWADLGIGEAIEFKLTSTIPSNVTGYESYSYIIHDTMSPGITFGKIESVIAYKSDGTKSPEDLVDYALDKPDAGKFTVDVKNIIALHGAGYTYIEIKYSAALNENAIIEQAGNPNEVYLEYSNNPNWDGTGTNPTGDTPKDDAVVYTYKLDVFKYTGNFESPQALDGVTFQLFNGSGNDSSVASFIQANGIYIFQGWIPKDTPVIDDTILTSVNGGNINIVGIDEGSYILHELETLPGYNRADDISVVVYNKLNGKNVDADHVLALNQIRGEDHTGDSNCEANGALTHVVNVYNGTGSWFPGTGGIGTTIFVLVGLLVMLSGILGFMIYRRKSSVRALLK